MTTSWTVASSVRGNTDSLRTSLLAPTTARYVRLDVINGGDDNIARIYATVAGTLVIDEANAGLASAVEAEGLRCVVTRTIMRESGVAASLARAVIGG